MKEEETMKGDVVIVEPSLRRDTRFEKVEQKLGLPPDTIARWIAEGYSVEFALQNNVLIFHLSIH